MDEELRRLQRVAASSGDPEAEDAFKAAYERAHGKGSFRAFLAEQQREARFRELRESVDGVEEFLSDPPEDYFPKLLEMLRPLLESGDLYHYDGYAPGSGDPDVQVFAANWNTATHWDGEKHIELDNSMSRLGELLEELPGVEINWSDQVTDCADCYRAIETQPTHYGWTPPYASTEYGPSCQGCIQSDPESYLTQYLEGNPDSALSPSLGVDLAEQGYVAVPQEYETGFHPGQNDNPATVSQVLGEEIYIERYVFAIDYSGQFDTHWSVWIHEDALIAVAENAFDHLEIESPENTNLADIGMRLAIYYLNSSDTYPDELETALAEITDQD